MNEIVFITGNLKKAEYTAKWLDRPLAHRKIDLDELQSLDAREVAMHKARQAYEHIRQPVLVEDTSLTFHALGRLPGTLIKWFLQELGSEGLCKILRDYTDRSATATATYALYDGVDLKIFEGTVQGKVAQAPSGSGGFGWDVIFIPENETKTLADMTDDEMRPFNHRARALEKLHAFLTIPSA
jgi:non-canonical purine NTP pyrophosphatase (RdgB/HAM1 family)